MYLINVVFLFSLGSCIGWILEVFFRRFFSLSNKSKKWINPGYLKGMYLPLYGFSLCSLYLLSLIDISYFDSFYLNLLLKLLIMAASVTVIEYITGLIFMKKMKIKLWDYSMCRGNIQGIICPQFCFYWFILCGVYYILINPFIDVILLWLSKNIGFLFFTGIFYGIFIVDFIYTSNLHSKLKNQKITNQLSTKIKKIASKSTRDTKMLIHNREKNGNKIINLYKYKKNELRNLNKKKLES